MATSKYTFWTIQGPTFSWSITLSCYLIVRHWNWMIGGIIFCFTCVQFIKAILILLKIDINSAFICLTILSSFLYVFLQRKALAMDRYCSIMVKLHLNVIFLNTFSKHYLSWKALRRSASLSLAFDVFFCQSLVSRITLIAATNMKSCDAPPLCVFHKWCFSYISPAGICCKGRSLHWALRKLFRRS